MTASILEGTLKLSAWYINTRRLSALTNAPLDVEAQVSIAKNSINRVRAMNYAEKIARELLVSGKIPVLAAEYINREAREQRILAGTWNVFTFRGMQKALARDYKGEPPVPAEMYGDIVLGDSVYKARGDLYSEHLCSVSSGSYLSRRKQVYVAGQFDFDWGAKTVEVIPIVIGDLIDLVDDLMFSINRWPRNARVYPEEIEAFAKMRGVPPPTLPQLEALRDFSERKVKDALAKILGEPFVPKDWGGERSDLYTSRIILDGTRLSAAFLLKGPAIFRRMHSADLGKRGDQIVRMFEEPAELLVLQHCHEISSPVVKQMEAFSVNPQSPRLYCIMDGADTFRLLKAYGFLD